MPASRRGARIGESASRISTSMEVCNECCSEEHDEPMPQATEHDANDPVTQDAILIASLVCAAHSTPPNACYPLCCSSPDQRGAPRRPDCHGVQRQATAPCFHGSTAILSTVSLLLDRAGGCLL